MVLRVTFDTHNLDAVCRPKSVPEDPRQTAMHKVHNALTQGRIEGFYSVTMLTIEGIMRKDRAGVFAGTRTVMQPETTEFTKNADMPETVREQVGDADVETGSLEPALDTTSERSLRYLKMSQHRHCAGAGMGY